MRPLLDETLMLLERKPGPAQQLQIVRAFNGEASVARVDPNKIKQVFWNLCDNAVRAMPNGGTLTVGIEHVTDWLRISLSRHRHRAGPAAARKDFRAAAIQF